MKNFVAWLLCLVMLLSCAVRLSDDYYLKKMRRLPSRKKLNAQQLPFSMTDSRSTAAP